MTTKWIQTIETMFATMQVVAILAILAITLIFQIYLHEPPCTLCILQRVGLIGIALGFLLNLRFGPRPSHYAIALLSGFYTAAVALRQIALHVIPGSGAFGNAVFGLHLYTWSFIITVLIVIATSLMLGLDKQYEYPTGAVDGKRHWLRNLLFALMCLVVFINMISTILECGFSRCPENPVGYKYTLKSGR